MIPAADSPSWAGVECCVLRPSTTRSRSGAATSTLPQAPASREATTKEAAHWADRGFYAVIEFEQSISKKFQEVVEVARRCPGYVELLLDGGRIVHRNLFRKPDLGSFPELFEMVAGWRSARFFINGDAVSQEIVRSTVLCYVERGGGNGDVKLECGQMRVRSWPLPDFVGCYRYKILLNRNPFYRESDQAFHWYEHGQVVTENGKRYLAVDKAQMRKYLSEAYHCPNFRVGWVEEAIAGLPDRIPLDAPERIIEWRQVNFPTFSSGSRWEDVMRRGVKAFPARSTEYKTFLRDMFLRGRWREDAEEDAEATGT